MSVACGTRIFEKALKLNNIEYAKWRLASATLYSKYACIVIVDTNVYPLNKII